MPIGTAARLRRDLGSRLQALPQPIMQSETHGF